MVSEKYFIYQWIYRITTEHRVTKTRMAVQRQRCLKLTVLLAVLVFVCYTIGQYVFTRFDLMSEAKSTRNDVTLAFNRPLNVLPASHGSKFSKSSMSRSILTVDDYLDAEEIKDIRELPDANLSRVYILNKENYFRLGDDIHLKIHLVNGRGDFMETGGDILRIWMQETEYDASSTGYIIDNGNGTYFGVVKALWIGKPEIRISLACSKYQIRMVYKHISKHGIFHYLLGGFQKPGSNFTEFTKCSVQPTIEGYTDTCNLTNTNYGLVWYCGKPKSERLSCSDWTIHTKSLTGRYKPKTDLDKDIMNYQYVELKERVIVTVVGEDKSVQSKPLLCNEYSKSDTWNDVSPTGYFYSQQWRTLYCTPPFVKSKENYYKCLKHRPLIIFGDSTVRQWYMHLYHYLDLQFVKGFELKHGSIHHPGYAVNETIGLTFIYAPHELPFYSGEFNVITNYRPLSTYIDYVKNNSHAIILLHWYMHFSRFVPKIFRQHIEQTKRDIIKLLERSNADIYIKSPHAIMDKLEYLPLDYIRIFQRKILKEVFQDIREKVTFLNEWDITVASANYFIHPSDKIVGDMVHEFLSHACYRKN